MTIPQFNEISPAPALDEAEHHGVNGHQPGTDDGPIPLARVVELPPFPIDSMPAPIADMVRAVAEATQTDPAMAGTSALSALSACTGGHAEIEVRPGWREPLNLYTATIAGPGERKSSVQLSMLRPILNVEAALAEAGAGALLEADTRKQIAVKDAERARAQASIADDKDKAIADAISAAQLAESITVPPIPRLVADDVTPEAAGSLLADHGGRLAIVSAEGGIFDMIAGRYSKTINMDLWLKGHAGDPMKVDRKGRPPEYVPRPALTLGLMIQPQVLTAIASNAEFRGRGLLARFLYSAPVSMVGHRQIAPPPVSDDTKNAYGNVVEALARGLVGWSGDPAVLTLTDKAQVAVQAIETAVEPTLAGNGELAALADWGAKYVGAVARIAGILHLAEHGPEHGYRKAVTAETVLAAARIGDYFKASAINTFAEMGADPVTRDARYLLDRVQAIGAAEVSLRDMQRAAQRLKTKQDVLAAVDRLVEHGYLIPLDQEQDRAAGGRPPSPRYRVIDTTA
ncbi:YfjI family protein [Mycolicibacterium sp. XJ1819]